MGTGDWGQGKSRSLELHSYANTYKRTDHEPSLLEGGLKLDGVAMVCRNVDPISHDSIHLPPVSP